MDIIHDKFANLLRIFKSAALFVCLACAQPVWAANLVWVGDFETGDLSQFKKHILSEGTYGFVDVVSAPSPVRAGAYAGRSIVMGPYKKRAELITAKEGGGNMKFLWDGPEYWVGFSLYFTEWEASGHTFMQIHAPNEPKGDPCDYAGNTFAVWPGGNGGTDANGFPIENRIDVRVIDNPTGISSGKGAASNTKFVWGIINDPGIWHDFVVRFKLSTQGDGYYEVWHNGEKIYSEFNMYNVNWKDSCGNLIPIDKRHHNGVHIGLYAGTPDQYLRMYYDEVRIAEGTNGYALVDPAGGAGGSPPTAPSNLVATTDSQNPSSQINLSWADNSTNELQFRVERKEGTGSYSLLTNKGANSTAHSDTNLSAGTTYSYKVRAENAAGPSTFSNAASATTDGNGGTPVTYEAESLTETHSSGDAIATISPTGVSGQAVRLTGDAVGDWVEFTVNVATTDTHNVKVQVHRNKYRAIFKLLIDGTQLGSTYDAHLDPPDVVEVDFGNRSLTAGNHTFRFEVTGRNSASSATDYQVAVDFIKLTPSGDTTPPSVSLTAPLPGPVRGNTAVTADAFDDVGVVGVQFKLDGANLGSEDTIAPYSIIWDSTGASDGSHTITAVARDAAANTTTSSAVSVTVDNTAPTVSVTAPTGGATVSGTSVTLSANASDAIGVVGVQFSLDGVDLDEDITSPYTISWDSTTVSDGSHSLTAVAWDAAGNTTTSSAVTFTVDNSGGGTLALYEAESLQATHSAGDTVTVITPTGVSGAAVRLSGNAVGDWVEFTINVATTDTYNVKVQFHRNKWRAIAKLLVDGTQLGSDYDAHIDPADVAEVDFGNRSLTAGNHAFRFEVTGRNSASSATDYQVAVDFIKLTPADGGIAFRSASSANSGSSMVTSQVVSKPAGVVSGDFMLAGLSVRNDTATVTAPTGWTLVRDISDGFRLWVYRKTAGANEPANYTWSISQSEKVAAGIVAFTGVSSSTPIQVENGAAHTSGGSTSHTTPTISTSGSSTWLVSLFGDRTAGGSTWTAPSGAMERVDTQTTTGSNDPSVSIHTQGPVAAGNKSHTATASISSAAAAMQIIALQP